MRCACLLKPRSAIGQTNLPEQACAQMNCASVSTLGRIARDVEEAPRRLPFGIGKERGAARFVAEDHKFPTGRSSRHNPTGSISTSRATGFGAVAANSAATRAPKEWPTSAGAESPSLSNSSP